VQIPVNGRAIRNRHLFSTDLLLLPVAVYISFVIRLERFDLGSFWLGYLVFTISAILITPLVFHRAGVYTRFWRYASVDELILLGSAVVISVLLAETVSLGVSWLLPSVAIPRSVPIIYFMISLIVALVPRLVLRLLWHHDKRREREGEIAIRSVRTLVMGAGSAGAMIVREMRENPQLGINVVGFLDDDPLKHRMRIHGVLVVGSHYDLPRLVREYHVEQVIIAMPTASGKTIRKIVDLCEKVHVKARIIPGVYELLDGKVHVNQLRDVQIEDLLRRKPVRTNITAVGELIEGKRILITGGGGSIGSELCRQVIRFRPSELVILGHGENSVFTIERELRQYVPAETTLHTVIADIRFPERMLNVFAKYQPELVFHAAAHKHVPLMEANAVEAVTNNVLGTRNLLEAALAVDVQQFVMISSDKAVNPTNIMGASKRTAELLVHQAAARSGKPYVAVRFGNVLGSRGSVVLTFKEQIAKGGPVTVTHPEMVRYFMTIPEAVQLVLQAGTLGAGGEVFTLDMGEPVKIVDLARDMIELSGLEVGRDIDIQFSGMRPGEKLYEELFIDGETYERTFHEKIFIACNASEFVPQTLDSAIAMLENAARRDDYATIIRMFRALVPSFNHPAVSVPETPAAAVRIATVAEPPLLARAVGEPEPVEEIEDEPPLLARAVGGSQD
jgi:FlaA1/EpsC-like NDP-sugar epimerase